MARQSHDLLRHDATPAGVLPATVLVFLFMANICDPTGTFRVKYVAFFVACLFSSWKLKYLDLTTHEIVVGLSLFLAWPTWSLLYGAGRGGNLPIGLSQVTPFLFVLLLASLLPSFDKKTPLRIFYICTSSLAFLVIVSFALVFLFPNNALSQRVFEALTSLHEQEGYFGTRTWGDVDVPSFYFSTTLFLDPTCIYYLFIGKMLRAGAVFLAIAMRWSKAGILIVLAFGVVYLVTTLASHPGSDPTDSVRMKWRESKGLCKISFAKALASEWAYARMRHGLRTLEPIAQPS